MMRRLLTTAGLSAVSAAASRGASFAGILVVAHYLGPAAFGQFTLIQTTALLFTTFCALSLGQMATKIVAEARESRDPHALSLALTVSYGSALLVSAVFMVPLLLLSPLLASKIGGSAGLAPAYGISTLLVFFGFLVSVQNGVSLALDQVRQQAIANLAAAPLVLAALVWPAMQRDVTWVLCGYVAAQAMIAIGQERALWRHRRAMGIPLWTRRTTREDWSVLWRLGLPSSLAGLLTLPTLWLAMVMLSRAPDGPLELGHFSLGNQARSMLMFGAGIVANAVLPMLASAAARQDGPEARVMMQRTMLLVVGVTAAVAGVAALVAPFVIREFAPEYLDSIVPLWWLLLSAVATAPTAVLMRKATADGRPGVLLVGNLVFSVTLLAASFTAVHLHAGASGLAVAFLLASLTQLATFLLLTRVGPAPGVLSKASP